MSVLSSELKLYKAKTNDDTSSNGGRMSSTQVVAGLAANLFPATGNADRLAGKTNYRKCFYKVAAADNSALINTRVYLENYTPGDDYIVCWLGTHTDTQASITGSEQKYGVGQLSATVLSGVTTIDVDVEDASEDIFKNGMFVRISDKADPDSAGNEEIVQLTADATYSTNTATLVFTPALSSGYSNTDTRVASLIDVDAATGDVVGTYTSFTVTTVGDGDFDDTTYPVIVDSIGGVYQQWTINFTSATAYDIVGDVLGTVGSGTIAGGAAPNNADFSEPYFTLTAAGFSGTWQTGDTITFTTTPASVPIWMKHVVPAGAASISNNKAVVAINGESA